MTIAYERVLDALADAGMQVKQRGDKARAQCPVHGSRGLTLSIRRREDKTSVKCFADCEFDDILGALNLIRRDLFDGDPPPGYRPPPRRVPSPWDPITRGPGIEHLLHRMSLEHALEADPGLRERARARRDACSACEAEAVGRGGAVA